MRTSRRHYVGQLVEREDGFHFISRSAKRAHLHGRKYFKSFCDSQRQLMADLEAGIPPAPEPQADPEPEAMTITPSNQILAAVAKVHPVHLEAPEDSVEGVQESPITFGFIGTMGSGSKFVDIYEWGKHVGHLTSMGGDAKLDGWKVIAYPVWGRNDLNNIEVIGLKSVKRFILDKYAREAAK